MRAVVQRVTSARVTIAGQVTGEIGQGLLVLVGVAQGDAPADGEWLAGRLAVLRVFADSDGKMNRSVRDVAGGILVVSQFTLLGTLDKGSRPSFNDAARPDEAIPLYEGFLKQMEAALGRPVAAGRFGADMQVSLVNDGPVTLIVDSRRRSG